MQNTPGTGGADVATGGNEVDAGQKAADAPAPASDASPSVDTARADRSPDRTPVTGNAFLYVGSGAGTNMFALDLAKGTLTPAKASPEGGDVMGVDPQQKVMYMGPNAYIVSLAIAPKTGLLSRIGAFKIPDVENTTFIHVHQSGKWIITAHYVAARAHVLSLQAGGAVGGVADTVEAGQGAHHVVVDSSGKFVFVPCPVDGTGFIAQYVFDAGTGKLTPNSPARVAAPRPRHMAFHPSGKFAYAMGEHDSMMTSFLYDAATGKLGAPESISAVPAGFPDSAGAHVVVHPTGKFVYGSNRGHNSIAIFAVNANTGRLTFVAHETFGATSTPSEFAQDPEGKLMFVPTQEENAFVHVFDISPQDGKLTKRTMLETARFPGFVGVVVPGGQ